MNSVRELLGQIVVDYPRKKHDIEQRLSQSGVKRDLPPLSIGPAVGVNAIPTFDPTVTRRVTPMLGERFAFAGSFTRFGEVWLGANEMAAAMRREDVRRLHLSLREHCEFSAPMLFPDGALTLFASRPELPSITYLVWRTELDEPTVWTLHGMETQEFDDLAEFLRWHLPETGHR